MNNEPFQSGITSEELSLLPVIQFNGQIFHVDRPESIHDAITYLGQQKFLGFDTETRPSFKKGKINTVSLLQLAGEDRVYLFRLNRIGLPPVIASILSSQNILKIGAAIRDDIRVLQKLQKFNPGGFIDLQQVVGGYGINDKGVRKLAGIILKGRISKSQQLTNWEAEEITREQQIYAATDAWVCLKMYKKLIENMV